MLEISLNGEAITVDTQLSLKRLLEDKGYGGQRIAVAINGEFVPRSCYSDTSLNNRDKIDIVKAVGGG